MRDGFRILDADRHVIEPIDLWRKYLPPELAASAPYMVDIPTTESLPARIHRLGEKGLLPPLPVPMLAGEPVWHKLTERARVELAWTSYRRAGQMVAGASPEAQLEAMDRTGIDAALLYPTFAMYLVGIDGLDPRLAAELAGAYNAWLHDFCGRDHARLLGVGLISPHDPAGMVAQLDRVAAYGWKVVVLRPNPIQGRTLGHPAYEPFWAECERRSIAVAIHEGTHARSPAAGADRFDTRFALHACSHPMEQMMALLALIDGGVLERHPGLRVSFLESGCGWLPYWLWRLDEIEYKSLAYEVAEHVRRPPSEYFRRQGLVAFEPEEPYLADVLRHIGEEHLVFGTDFPHLDHDDRIVDRALALRERIPGDALRKMLWDNAARFCGLDG
ncbi:amidohydrolase family protein [Polyangium spumosum]|uniref:Amidohydrolase family protein n=1 Tax=Polyangium spumosum TaxID=889282 RepID=A0A6N7PJL4_9BACT|nr:amidohydrolase family protein [Polyangium spumosum]MRG92332.1 amidohydrolase family protein [Polyangium spumosum]